MALTNFHTRFVLAEHYPAESYPEAIAHDRIKEWIDSRIEIYQSFCKEEIPHIHPWSGGKRIINQQCTKW